VLQALFSSRVRVKLLAHFFGHPDEQFYARELARQTGEHYNAVWQELGNLERLGLLIGNQEANVKYYRLNPGFPLYPELKSMILKTTGLGQALRDALAHLGRVEVAFIYGSVATGEEDSLSDLDLMLVGEIDLLELSGMIDQLEKDLRRQINYLALTPAELAQRLTSGEPFLQNVLAEPKVMLTGTEDVLRRIAEAATA
jgi:predicted nucleotidyltransferase